MNITTRMRPSFADSEIWPIAEGLIGTHGEEAPLYALQCLDLALEIGNFGRAQRWRLVLQATRWLISVEETDHFRLMREFWSGPKEFVEGMLEE